LQYTIQNSYGKTVYLYALGSSNSVTLYTVPNGPIQEKPGIWNLAGAFNEGSLQSFVVFNCSLGLAVQPPQQDGQSPGLVAPTTAILASLEWDILYNGNDEVVIRLHSDERRNLRVNTYGGNETPFVTTGAWEGGKPSELWRLVPNS
jgi:hypothetical protein